MRKFGGTWPFYTEACRRDVDELLKAGGSLSAYRANKDYGAGPKEGSHAYNFEREICRMFNVEYAVAVNSGTAALHCGLAALDLKGKEVIVSPYTFSASVSAVLLSGGTPRFCDVDPNTYCITAETVKPHITKRTAAILPVDLFGRIADYKGLYSLGIPIVEDACQAVGASRDGVFAGVFGRFGAYSFNGGKNVPAGESGALVTNDPEIAERARLLMNHAENFGCNYVGYNYRPNEVTCCVARHGLQSVMRNNEVRRQCAKFIGDQFHDSAITDIKTPDTVGDDHAFYVYPIKVLTGNREFFAAKMRRRGINVGCGYVTPTLNEYPAFKKYATKPLPNVRKLSYETLCILDCVVPEENFDCAIEPIELCRVIKECLA